MTLNILMNDMGYYALCYPLHICDARRSYVVMTDKKPGLIGPLYTFSPKKAVIVSDAYDEADFHYFRKAKVPIPKGTEIEISVWFQNFYGCYFSVKYEGHKYDINTECVEFLEESNNS